jgi:MoaA/NifB/PqqE/SkfB family radical SAM enzyme
MRITRAVRPENIVKAPSFVRGPLWVVYNKKHLYLYNLSPRKLLNILKLLYAYLLKKRHVTAYPVILKMDVTPLCQLKCPICIHSKSFEPAQQINSNMKMPMDLFRSICDEISGKTMVLSLHYLGEPLFNEHIYEMVEYATRKKLNTYFTTNLSLNLSDTQLRRLVESGLSTIIVALDGLSQGTYGRTRINGNIELVKQNIRRLLAIRKELHRELPFVMIQSLLFEHNLHEKEQVTRFCEETGVDSLVFSRGDMVPWKTQYRPRSRPKTARGLPLCMWPYFSAVVLCDGDVVPCCFYRLETAYARDVPRVPMGSLRDQRLIDIFNNDRYLASRRLADQPSDGADASANFCYGCKYLYG